MNKFGQKIRDCGHSRISSARPGAAMASVRNWAVPAVMAAALMLSGCQTPNPDSAEGESNSLLKTLAVAFVGGAAIWGSTGGGNDNSPLLPTLVDEANTFSGPFEVEAVVVDGQVRYVAESSMLNAPAPPNGFDFEFLLPLDFTLAPGSPGDFRCEGRICTGTIAAGDTSLELILVPTTLPGAGDPPPMISLIPNDDYDIQRLLIFPDPVILGDGSGQASFTVFSNAPPNTGDRIVARFRVEGNVAFRRVDGVSCNLQSICEVTISPGQTSGTLVIAPPLSFNPANDPIPLWRLSLIPDDVDPDLNNDNYDIRPTLGFFSAEPTGVTQGGRATFTIFSNTPAPPGGLAVMANIAREGFRIDESDPGQLAAIAAIVGRQANHIPCAGRICTVTIPAGETSVTFRLIPQGLADPDTVNRWEVSLVPDANDPFEIESESVDNPIEVANTPTGVRGGFSPFQVIDAVTRQVSTETPELDRAAGPGGFEIEFTLPPNLMPVADQTVEVDGRTVPVTVTCQPIPTACTVTIPETQTQLVLMFEPIDTTDTTEPVAIVLPPSDDYTLLDPPTRPDIQTPDFVVGFDTSAEPTVDPDNGEVTFTFVSETAAPDGGLAVSFSITGPAFMAMLPDDTPLVCQGNVCTVVIPAGSDTVAFILVPQGRDTTWTVAIVPDTTNNIYGINDDSLTPVEVTTLPTPDFVVGFSGTPVPTPPDPVTGEVSGDVTFTVISDEMALEGGLEVNITIGGDAFMAIPLNADGSRMDMPLVCPLNVCTITILEGSNMAAFVLVPDGPRSPDSDLFERWTVAIVDESGYNIDANNPTAAVAIERLTPIAAGGGAFVLAGDSPVRVGRLSTSFDAFGRDGALPDVLEIPSAPRVLATDGNSFASGYGYFADDGGFQPVESQGVTGDILTDDTLALPPPNLGIVNQISGQVDITFPMLDSPAGPGGFNIVFTVSGSNLFTATLLDAVDLADRTSVPCDASNVCTVTIPEGETGLPSSGNRVVLMPTVPVPGNPPNWMVMINTVDPILPDPLSVNRANNDEAVFYARRGNQLVARFQTTGTFTDTAQVETITFGPFSGTDSLRPFVRVPFDPAPFGPMRNCAGLSGGDLTTCTNFNSDLTNLVNSERNAHNTRQTRLSNIYTSFGNNYNDFASRLCANAGNPANCERSFSNENELTLLVVDGFGGIGPLYRGDLALSEGEDVNINRPVAIALAITSTLIATADNAQELVYSYLRDSDDNGLDVNPETGGFFFDQIVGSVDFALYQSGDIPNPLPPSGFSISDIDPASELLGASNVRTFLFENEFSAIGAWLIPPTDAEVTADANAPYAAAAAHWFGFETPADRIPTTGEAVYGGIAVGDLRQVSFRFADTDSDPLTPLDETVNVESYYVRGNAHFEADFANDEMDGRFELFALNPRDVYGDPSLLLSQSLDFLVVNWEGQILPDGGGFANNFIPVTEPVVGPDGVQLIALDEFDNPALDEQGEEILLTRETFAATGTLEQPLRVTDTGQQNPDRVGVFDALVDFDRIGGVDPSMPAPIGSETLFSVFGKFFGPGTGAFPEEVAGELRVFNSRTFQLTPPDLDGDGVPVRNTGTSESVTNSLEVHFTASDGTVPDGRFNQPDIADEVSTPGP